MRKLKKRIATALIVTMMCSQALTVPAAPADEGLADGMQLVDGNWTYWRDGEMVTNELIPIKDEAGETSYYYFKDDGSMASNELFERNDIINDEEDFPELSYARQDGKLALGQWILIDGDQMTTTGEGDWYNFRSDKDKNKIGLARKNGPKLTNSKYYCFTDEGIMLSREFADLEKGRFEDNGTDEEIITCFFEYEGQRTENGWRYIDGAWSYFIDGAMNTEPLTADYKVVGDEIATSSNTKASSSNAMYEFDSSGKLVSETQPYAAIESLTLSSAVPKTVKVGSKVQMDYDIQLASASNVAHPNDLSLSNRDVWIEDTNWDFDVINRDSSLFKINFTVDAANKKMTVTYTPYYSGSIDISAVIDDVASEPVAIESQLDVSTDDKKADEIERILKLTGNVLESVRSIRNLLSDTEDTSIITKVWKSMESDIKKLEQDYLFANRVKIENPVVSYEAEKLLGSGTLDIIGAGLNAGEGETVGLTVDVADKLELDKSYPKQVAFDLSCGDMTEFEIPVIVKVPLPKGMSKAGLDLYHDHGGKISKIDFTISGDTATFVTDGMSTFAFAGKAETSQNGGSGGSGSGGGGSTTGSSTTGTVTTDAKKGYVNSLTGIITGSGSGYSKWNSDEKGWKLQYADGTFAAGAMVTGADGNSYEQPTWELINGAWYPFGADGYVKSGMVYDPALGGTFYVDINTGMKTGWQNLNGVWHYFNTKADGKNGIMLTDTVIDGYYIDANGIWDGQEKKTV